MLLSCDTQYAPNLILQHGYAYDYDFNGNRLTANGSTYTTSTNNELTSDGTWSYTYDDEGNRLTKTNSTNRELYEWDYRNRLTSVTKQEFNTETQEWTTIQIVEYTYDYNNVWIRKVIGNEKTIFIPENYQTTVQIDNGTVTHHYLWMPNTQDKLLADVTTNDVLWALTDHLGTIRNIIGTTTNTHLIYDAFGNLISGTNPLLFAYTGKAFDTSTQLQNNINRWYDPATGRWLSIDPIDFEGNDTNLYWCMWEIKLLFIWIVKDLKKEQL
ncbi:MAG: RHS repeat-associated core domain-containing protein [Planctomycetia bacterium]|nr:RHS repeat-associated core domain-containing protein [Planctomycetia bacterium]